MVLIPQGCTPYRKSSVGGYHSLAWYDMAWAFLVGAGESIPGSMEILLNNATLGWADNWGWTDTSQYQGWGYDAYRWSSGAGVGAVYAIIGVSLMGYNPVLWGGAETIAGETIYMAQNALKKS